MQRAIKAIQDKCKTTVSEERASVFLPKIYLRKILGYQNKHKERYKAMYDVDITYDQSLIADDVYPIHELTEIVLSGNEENMRKLKQYIEEEIEALNVVTMQVSLSDGKYLKESIYSLKTQIDPAELRIKRTTNHTEMKDLNHPFYFIPNYSKDVLIIGFEDEVRRAEGIISDFLCKKYSNKRTYTLSHLLPLNLHENIKRVRAELQQRMSNLQMYIYEPNPPRKHITVLLMGTWPEIRLAKRYLDKQIERVSQGSLADFQGFVMLQQARFTYKNLKRFLLENSTKVIKHWDLSSSLFESPAPVAPGAVVPAAAQLKSHIPDPLISSEDKLIPDEALRRSVYSQMESETIINLLFASGRQRLPVMLEDMRMTKKDVLECLSFYLKETLQTYEQSVAEAPSYMQEVPPREAEAVHPPVSHSRSKSRARRRSSSRSRSRSHSRSRSRSKSKSRSRSRSRSRSSSSKRRSEERSEGRRKHHRHSRHHHSPSHHSRKHRHENHSGSQKEAKNGEVVAAPVPAPATIPMQVQAQAQTQMSVPAQGQNVGAPASRTGDVYQEGGVLGQRRAAEAEPRAMTK